MPADPKRPPEEPLEELVTEPEETHAQARLAPLLLDALEAMDEGPDAVEEVHRRFFGEDVSAAFEQAALAHVRDGAGGVDDRTPDAATRLESFVQLSFKHARDESSSEEDAELATLEAELGTAPVDAGASGGGEDE